MHWLWHQLILTWVELKDTITIPHIVVGVIYFLIVHFAAKRGVERGARNAERLLVLKIRQLRSVHHWQSHDGDPRECKHPDCDELLGVILNSTP